MKRYWKTWGLAVFGVAAVIKGLAGTGIAQGTWKTPEIREIVALQAGGGVGYAMRGELGDTGTYVGLALICAEGGDEETEVVAFFGGFPADRRAVQLAVRSVDGTLERFGAVVSGGPESGFHSPRLVDSGEIQRFVDVALRAGALVSNGYRSFWNRVPDERNSQVREWLLTCLKSEVGLNDGQLGKPERLGLEYFMLEGVFGLLRKSW